MALERFALLPAIVLAVWSAGCATRAAADPDAGATGRPKTLRYVYAPTTEEPQAQSIRLDRLKDYLHERLKIDVELYKVSGGYGAIIEALRAKKIDVATLGPFGYLIASEKAGAEVLVVRATKDTAEGIYSGAIEVRKDRPIRNIGELHVHASVFTLSYVDRDFM